MTVRTAFELDPTVSARAEALIVQAYDRLAEMLADGDLRETAFDTIVRNEQSWGQGNAAVRMQFGRYLVWCIHNPTEVGAHLTHAPYECACLDQGMIELPDGTVVPCERCNGRCARLHREGHFRPGHTCKDCAPGKRKRGADSTEVEESKDERAEADIGSII